MSVKSFFCGVALCAAFVIGLEVSVAQPGGGGGGGMGGGPGGMGGGPGMMMQQQGGSVEGAMGLFEIDKDAIIKKCKVKDDATKAKVTRLVNSYIIEMENIKSEMESQKASQSAQRGQRGQGGQGGDSSSTEQGQRPGRGDMSSLSDEQRSEMQSKMKARREEMMKLRERCTKMHEDLKSGLADVLTEKQTTKWERYYKGLCQDNYFGEYSLMQGQGEGQGQGQGRGPGGMSGGMSGGMGGGMSGGRF